MGNGMPSEWFKTTSCKIPHLKFLLFFQTVSDKNYEENCYLGNLVFLPLSLLTVLSNNEQNLRQAMLWVRNIV